MTDRPETFEVLQAMELMIQRPDEFTKEEALRMLSIAVHLLRERPEGASEQDTADELEALTAQGSA